MYAIVKTGGKQYRVAEGDVISIEKLEAAPGDEVALPAILFVDGDQVTHDAESLATVAVTAEVVAQTKGPKIRIHKFKNKTGYHKRMGHRQKLTEIRIVSVASGSGEPASAEVVTDDADAVTTDAVVANDATANDATANDATANDATAKDATAKDATANEED